MAPRKTAAELNFDANAWVKGRISDLLKRTTRTFRSRGDAKKLAERIAREVDKEISGIFPLITRQLIGTPSFHNQTHYLFAKDFDNDGQIATGVEFHRGDRNKPFRAKLASEALAVWNPLAGSTVREKGNNLFFIDQGELQAELRFFDWRSKLGATTVEIAYADDHETAMAAKAVTSGTFTTRQVLASVTVNIFPNLPATQRSFLASDGWHPDPSAKLEGALFGNSSKIRKKLAGPVFDRGIRTINHRPLMQPVLRYYLAYKLPRVVAGAITGGRSS